MNVNDVADRKEIVMSASRQARLILSLTDGVSGPAQAAAGALGVLDTRIRKMDRAIGQTRGQLFNAAGVAAAAGAAIAMPIRSAVDFESALADIGKVSGFDAAGLEAYGKQLRHLATTEIPMAVDELAALSAAAAQAGVPDEDLLDFTRLTAKVAVAWEMTGDQAGEALAKLRTALKLTNAETAAFADAINHTADSTAASAPDLIDYTKRVASMGEFFGFAKEETLAFGAAMIAAGAAPEVAATSFRNMGRALTRGTSATKAMRGAYKALGLDAQMVAKRMQQDAVGTTLEVIDRLGRLPKEMQAAVMSDLFGDEARALAPLLNDHEQLRRAIALTADEQSYLNSVGREFEKRAATSAYRLQRFKSQLSDIALSIGGSLLPALNQILTPLGNVAMRFSQWADANGDLVRKVVAVSGALIGLRVAGLAGKLGLLLVGREALVAARSLTAAAVAIKGFTAARMVAGLAAARKGLLGFAAAASIIGTRGAIGMTFGGIGKGVLKILNPLRWLKAAAIAARGAMLFTGVGTAIAAIAAAGTWIWRNFEGLTEFAKGIGEGFSSAFAPVAPLFEPIISRAGRLVTAVNELLGPVDASASEWRSWGVSVGETVGNVIRSIIELPARVAGLSTALYDTGVQMIQSLWDGAVSKFNEMVGWFQAIPGRIKAAIGRIDLSNIISWPSWPSWNGEGSQPTSPQLPAGGNIAGARAGGGPVRSGLSYLVGEKGTELFTPTQNGNITSNSDLRSGVGGSRQRHGDVIIHAKFNIAAGASKGQAHEILEELNNLLKRSQETSFGGLLYGAK